MKNDGIVVTMKGYELSCGAKSIGANAIFETVSIAYNSKKKAGTYEWTYVTQVFYEAIYQFTG